VSLFGQLLNRPTADEVVRDNAAMVYRQLRRIFGPQADVDDAFQAVFVEVLRSLPTFAGRAKLSTWIRRITWNVAYQEMRLTYRQPKTTGYDDRIATPGGDEDAEARAASQESRRRLYHALDSLEPKERLAVVMHDIEGCTLKEISRASGRPLQTIASQLHAGRARIAAHLQGDVLWQSEHPREVEAP
jgi:RNA polymerase sigma-70 factor, ECF subfamily